MQLTCLYHPVKDMIVTDDEEYFNKLVASGVWFEHPTKAKDMRDKYEKQIRQSTGKRCKNGERSRKEI